MFKKLLLFFLIGANLGAYAAGPPPILRNWLTTNSAPNLSNFLETNNPAQNYFGVWDDYPNGFGAGYNAYVTVGTLYSQRRISASFSGTNSTQLGTPAPFYQNGKYYFAFMTKGYPVGGANVTNNFGIYVSDDLSNWRLNAYVDCSAPTPAESLPIKEVWSPEWFVDADGSVYVVVNLATNALSSAAEMKPYVVKATSGDLTTWTSPTNLSGIPGSSFDAFIIRSNSNYQCWVRNAGTSYIEVYTSPNLLGPYTILKSGNWAGWGNQYEAFQVLRLNDGTWYIQMTSTSPFNGTWYARSADFNTWTTPKRMTQSGTQGHGSLWPVPTGTMTKELVEVFRPGVSNATYGTTWALGPFSGETGASGGPKTSHTVAIYSGGSYTTFAMYSTLANQFITDGWQLGVPFYFSRYIGAGGDIFYNSGANNNLLYYGNQIAPAFACQTNYVAADFIPTSGQIKIVASNNTLYAVSTTKTNLISAP